MYTWARQCWWPCGAEGLKMASSARILRVVPFEVDGHKFTNFKFEVVMACHGEILAPVLST
jgi:hypothetical protein